MNTNKQLKAVCDEHARVLINHYELLTEDKLSEISDILYKVESEKKQKDLLTDLNIDYNDEIIEIVDVGIKECVDIGVTGDNLFYCNDILTKNSIGLPSTVDLLLGIIFTEEMDNNNYIQYKQLKNRMGDCNYYRKWNMGIDKAKMKLSDISNQPQQSTSSNVSVIPTSIFDNGNRTDEAFSKFKYN